MIFIAGRGKVKIDARGEEEYNGAITHIEELPGQVRGIQARQLEQKQCRASFQAYDSDYQFTALSNQD